MIRPVFAVTLLAIAPGITPAAMPQQLQRPEVFEEITGAQAQSVRRGMEWLEKTQKSVEVKIENEEFFTRAAAAK